MERQGKKRQRDNGGGQLDTKKTATNKMVWTGKQEWVALSASQTLANVDEPGAYTDEERELLRDLDRKTKLEYFKGGHVLAVVRLDDGPCTLDEAREKGWGKSKWAKGKYCYHIGEVHILEKPVPIKGGLGFVRIPHDKQREIITQLPTSFNGPLTGEQGLYHNDEYKHLGVVADSRRPKQDEDDEKKTLVYGQKGDYPEGQKVKVTMDERNGVEMRLLVLKQPYLKRIMDGDKDVENRSKSLGETRRTWKPRKA